MRLALDEIERNEIKIDKVEKIAIKRLTKNLKVCIIIYAVERKARWHKEY